jgi:hypothetical protein
MAGLITTGGSGNWSSTTNNAPWPGGTKPASGDWIEIAAGHTVTLDESTPTLGAAGIKNVSGSNTSVLDISGTWTINGNVSCSGTAAGGFITVGTGDALTILGKVTQTGSGKCIVSSGSGTVTINVGAGNTAIDVAGSGTGLSSGSTGAFAITGDVTTTTGTGIAVAANTTSTITGNLSASSGTALNMANASSITLDGTITTTGGGTAINVSAGTLVWTGSRAIAGDAYIVQTGGTINYTNLTLAVTGQFAMRHNAGAVTTTGCTVTLQAATSGVAIIGKAATTSFTLDTTGPVLPAANKVLTGEVQFGYAGSLQTPSYTAASGGGAPVFGGHMARRV